MSDQPQSNGTIPAAVARVSQTLINTLGAAGPQFLLLVLINAAFITVVMWFLNNQMDQRLTLVTKVIDRCMEIALEHPPPK